MSKISVDAITDEAGTGAPDFPNGMTGNGAALTGVLTPTGDGSALTNLPVSPTTDAVLTNLAVLNSIDLGTSTRRYIQDGIVDTYTDTTGLDLVATSGGLDFNNPVGAISATGSLAPTAAMTSDTLPAPQVAAGVYQAWKLFGDGGSINIHPAGTYASLDNGASVDAVSFEITPTIGAGYSPRGFTVHGSTNGSTWVLKHTSSNYTWPNGVNVPHVFPLSSANYRHWKFTSTQAGVNNYGYVRKFVVHGVVPSSSNIVSDPFTADTQPTKATVSVSATAIGTINTDLKAYASRDNGTTWTQGTLSSVVTNDSIVTYRARDIDLSSQPAGTAMRYKLFLSDGGDAGVTQKINNINFTWE